MNLKTRLTEVLETTDLSDPRDIDAAIASTLTAEEALDAVQEFLPGWVQHQLSLMRLAEPKVEQAQKPAVVPGVHPSPKIQALKTAWQRRDPERAAEEAARQFERAAIPIPKALCPAEDDPWWKVRNLNEAASLYRDVVISGQAGVPVRDLRECLAKTRCEEVLRILRRSGAVVEVKEPRVTKGGHTRSLIVLRAATGSEAAAS